MRPKRDEAFRLVMTPAEKTALERLAERDGYSQAGVIRRLVRREAQALGVWFDHSGRSEGEGTHVPAQ